MPSIYPKYNFNWYVQMIQNNFIHNRPDDETDRWPSKTKNTEDPLMDQAASNELVSSKFQNQLK